MYTKDYDSFMSGAQMALSLPIRSKCVELSDLLSRANLLELHNFFPILIDNIFGPQGTVCWGLRSISDYNIDDFRHLCRFFAPQGPLFQVIYVLLKDVNIKYEFPLAYLPTRLRQMLQVDKVYSFYGELVYINPQNKQATSLLLNPFDYFFFHFSFYLINPWQQRAGSSVTSWNTVYYSLCCDYILHFLPTDPAVRILPEIYYNGKNPLKQVRQSSNFQSHLRGTTTGYINSMHLNKESTPFQNYHPRNDIWRSETVLTAITDMWLCNDAVIQSVNANDLNNSFNTPMRLQYNELPTGEYIRIVRVLIKQLHSFSDSAKCDDTHLCELKKNAIPMIQNKFYIFLRNLIHRWPLDGSFRLVLELWLSYIQPWRYPADNIIKKRNVKENNPDSDDISLRTDKQQLQPTKEHMQFIAENFLCYALIFEQLLPRFIRVDLISPKMSLMLYRITKVFDQPNLPHFLREIERSTQSYQSSSTGHKKYSSSLFSTKGSTPSPTSNESSKHKGYSSPGGAAFINSTPDKNWSVIVRQKIMELEGPSFTYKPLFSDPPAQEVIEILIQIRQTINKAQDLIRDKEQEEKELYSGFWGSIKYFFQYNHSNDEFSLDDRKKVPIYLEVSLSNLMDMFEIKQEILSPELISRTTDLNQSAGLNTTNDFQFLTPEKVRSRLRTMKYQGDPDLQPIRSDEFAFLVRSFYQMAAKCNERFGQQFNQVYNSPSFWGRFSRQILQPPTVVYKYDKSVMGSKRISVQLPPRVSFRPLANYRFIGYLTFGAIVALLFGYRTDLYLFFLIAVYVFYKMLKALPVGTSIIRHNYSTEESANSFNDTF